MRSVSVHTIMNNGSVPYGCKQSSSTPHSNILHTDGMSVCKCLIDWIRLCVLWIVLQILVCKPARDGSRKRLWQQAYSVSFCIQTILWLLSGVRLSHRATRIRLPA